MSLLARSSAMLTLAFAFATGAFGHGTATELSQRAGFEQRLGAHVPSQLSFRDETGRRVQLADYYGAVPIVLVFAWYGCTTLCPTVLGNLGQALYRSGLALGSYRVVVASIDPRDSPADALRMKRTYVAASGRGADAGAWHLLTEGEAAIAQLTRAAGFRYAYDEDTHQYAHPAGIVVLTPDGTIARYFLGFDFTPAELHAAIDAAADHHIASPVRDLLLLCFHLAPSGRYSVAVLQALRIAGATLLVVAWIALAVAARRRRPAR
jgi:protein SCO1